MKSSLLRSFGKWLLAGALLGFGLAMAQSEPTLGQIYEAAQSGRMDQAQTMMQQVLVAHPGSGKAHFVQAELFARQGKLGLARESLATAEKLAPGLPSIKPESVQSLRTQLAARPTAPPVNNAAAHRPAAVAQDTVPVSSFPWGLALALGGGAIGLAIYLTRKKPAQIYEQQPQPYSNQGASGLSGPQGFGASDTVGAAPMQQAYGQPTGSGLGGKIMGGVATGLAVGAGMMAAQAIGRTLTGHHDQGGRPADAPAGSDFQSADSNPDMGGENFGVNDATSWDDAGGGDLGGGDWDN